MLKAVWSQSPSEMDSMCVCVCESVSTCVCVCCMHARIYASTCLTVCFTLVIVDITSGPF